MRVVVQGVGVVGKMTTLILEDAGHSVEWHDPVLGCVADGWCDVLVICTPCRNGYLDPLPAVESHAVVVRSTVLPAAFEILPKDHRFHWPEFLTERTAEHDARHPDKLVWGSDTPIVGEVMARDLLGKHFDSAPFCWMPLECSCIAKIAINSFYAAKVLLANAVYDAVDPDFYHYILQALSLDQRINLTHTDVWQDGFRGAGGKCLPKDLGFLAKLVDEKPTGPLLKAMCEVNERLMEIE